jgi:hypothetical protein
MNIPTGKYITLLVASKEVGLEGNAERPKYMLMFVNRIQDKITAR